MPEGVEVAHLVSWLNKKIKGRELKSISITSGRYVRHGLPKGYVGFTEALPLRVKGIHNKGKFIWIELENDWMIWITLGMTGWFKSHKTSASRSKWVFDAQTTLYFSDLRNFGTLRFIHDRADLLKEKLKTLGPYPLSKDGFITFKEFERLWNAQKGTQKIGQLLLNQKFISGIGNYLRAEILYVASIDPNCKLEDIPIEFRRKLWHAIYDVFMDNYKRGVYQYKFKVYRKKKDPKGNPVIAQKMYGRTMWWSPNSVKLKCS